MAKSNRTVTRASEHGGALGPNGAIDAGALTDLAGARIIHITPPALTQNSTTTAYGGCLGIRCILIAAYTSAHTAPIASGGTLSYNVNVSVAGAAVVTQATIDPQTLTALIGKAMTLQATNDALVIGATDTIEVTAVANDHVIGTAEVGPKITLIVRPLGAVNAASTITGDINGA